MALKLELKAGEKMIINGAVIENGGSHARLLLHNQAQVMRGREILTAEDSHTPAARTYFALQCAYLFPEHRPDHLAQFDTLLTDFLKASPSSQPIVDKIRLHLAEDQLYKALKETQNLVSHEARLMQNFHKMLADQFEQDTPEDEPAGSESGATDQPEDERS